MVTGREVTFLGTFQTQGSRGSHEKGGVTGGKEEKGSGGSGEGGRVRVIRTK